MSGRIGALAIRPSNGQFILGAAQGGIWLYDAATGTWSAKTSDQTTQAIGALAIAPSNDAIVYAGTGEGALSGDSYFGNGVLKSTDGGNTWTHVSGDYFRGVATSRIVVDPTNAEPPVRRDLCAAAAARAARRRKMHSRFGVWESKNGGVDWTLIQEVEGQPRRDRPRDRSAEPADPLLVVPRATRSTRARTAARAGRRS